MRRRAGRVSHLLGPLVRRPGRRQAARVVAHDVMWHCKPPRGGEHQPLIIIEACLSKHGDEHLMQKSIRGVGVLQVVQDTRSPTDRVVNAAHDVVHVTPGHTITTTAFLWTKQNVGGKSRFKVKRKRRSFLLDHMTYLKWRGGRLCTSGALRRLADNTSAGRRAPRLTRAWPPTNRSALPVPEV